MTYVVIKSRSCGWSSADQWYKVPTNMPFEVEHLGFVSMPSLRLRAGLRAIRSAWGLT